MIKVRVFQSRDRGTLQDQINGCIENKKVIDIKFSSATEGAYVNYSALVMLDVVVPQRPVKNFTFN